MQKQSKANIVILSLPSDFYTKPVFRNMHDIEPFYLWRDDYIAAEDERSPFYGRIYDEFVFTQKIYNYFIHPQWDEFGSQTLYTKILFADYDHGFAILEFIGEWNDCLYNDIMYLKQEVLEPLMEEGIFKFIFICENVLNFHGSDDCYYEELSEETTDEEGWVVLLNVMSHVSDEMKETRLHHFLHFDGGFNEFNWRPHKPVHIFKMIEMMLNNQQKRLAY
ncbi:MAG TPA: hypothetical protein PKC40_04340 [Saprospiraceae bacterium]|nr:hypothetical protein [Saprospiraceae bacterium]